MCRALPAQHVPHDGSRQQDGNADDDPVARHDDRVPSWRPLRGGRRRGGGLDVALQSLDCQPRVHPDGTGVSANLRPTVQAIWKRLQVAALDGFQVAERNFRLVRHLLQRQPPPFAGGPQQFADDMLHLDVHDDGHGGADARNGTGLTGIHDRVAALGGSVRVDSRDGAGTRVEVSLPCASP